MQFFSSIAADVALKLGSDNEKAVNMKHVGFINEAHHGKTKTTFFLAGARCLSAGHHLRLTRGPAGNRTTTGSLSASPRTTPYQLSRGDT